jgi:ABC-type transport system involved in multi-copper enzyme maturation permease subunit
MNIDISTIALWLGLSLLGAIIIFIAAISIGFLAVMFGEDRESADGLHFYKGDLDDD